MLVERDAVSGCVGRLESETDAVRGGQNQHKEGYVLRCVRLVDPAPLFGAK